MGRRRMSACQESGFRLPAMDGAIERDPGPAVDLDHCRRTARTKRDGRRQRAPLTRHPCHVQAPLFEFGMVAHAPGSKQPAQRVNPVFAIPFYGFRPLKGLVKTRKPGALGLGFNWNFPLAYGHSSRTLRSKIPASPSG